MFLTLKQIVSIIEIIKERTYYQQVMSYFMYKVNLNN